MPADPGAGGAALAMPQARNNADESDQKARRAAQGPPVKTSGVTFTAQPAGSTLIRASPPGSLGAPEYLAMNFSVFSRAVESGTCTGGDFIR